MESHDLSPHPPCSSAQTMRRGRALGFRLVLRWEKCLRNSVHYSVASISMNFHKVVDHLMCVTFGSVKSWPRKKRWECYFITSLGNCFFKYCSRVFAHRTVDLWLSIGGEVVLFTLKDVNSGIYWHILYESWDWHQQQWWALKRCEGFYWW